MHGNQRRRDEAALSFVCDEISSRRIRLYRNVIRQPYVICDHPSFPPLHSHLLSQDFRAWLVHFIWNRKQFLLGERETDRILNVLAGRSLSEPLDKIDDPALLQIIENEPVVASVLEFMQGKERHERNMEALWKELREFAQGRRLLVRGRHRFPGGANVLSRKLTAFKGVLALVRINVEIRRSNGCVVTLTRRLDGSSHESSTEPSTHNSQNSSTLLPKDDLAERLKHLDAKRTTGSLGNERS